MVDALNKDVHDLRDKRAVQLEQVEVSGLTWQRDGKEFAAKPEGKKSSKKDNQD